MNLKQRLRNNNLDPRDPERDNFDDWEKAIADRIEGDLLTTGKADYFAQHKGRHIEKKLTLAECINDELIDPCEINNKILALLKAKEPEQKLEALEEFAGTIKNQVGDLSSDAASEECYARIEQAKRGEGEFSNDK